MLNGSDVLTACAIQKDLTEPVDGDRDALVKEHVLKWFIPFATLMYFLYQAMILVQMRYLQTSIDLAIKNGDPTADSLGYPLPICVSTDAMIDDVMPLAVGRARQHRTPAVRQLGRPCTVTLERAVAMMAAAGQPDPGVDTNTPAHYWRV